MFVEEFDYDDAEGLAFVTQSYSLGPAFLEEELGFDEVFRLEFIRWIDGRTFEIGFNGDQSFIMQMTRQGELLLKDF